MIPSRGCARSTGHRGQKRASDGKAGTVENDYDAREHLVYFNPVTAMICLLSIYSKKLASSLNRFFSYHHGVHRLNIILVIDFVRVDTCQHTIRSANNHVYGFCPLKDLVQDDLTPIDPACIELLQT